MALDTAIISGASEGIGAAFSKILIKHGWEVIGISRSEKKLNQLKKTIKINKKNFKPYVCNVKD
ncbi:MAG: SDR family NAD(P)-dependent oxidoreductase, partial [Alphaproteobacteria bacterium]|nr:SDR family NAD(P)-dependent oxidoreductase [Alphaproteobacteria bacterium]